MRTIANTSDYSNIRLAGVSLTGRQFVGGLAGYNNGGQISGSAVSGTVIGTYSAGGLIGYNADGAISGSRASASVTGTFSIGGLLGQSSGADGAIADSYATGNVTGNSGGDSVGGLIGYKYGGSIGRSHASGKVSGKRKTGGLPDDEYAVLIHDSSASGDVSGTTEIGGLVGGGSGGGEIVGSYASGKVSGRQTVGGLMGRNYGVAISGSHASGEVAGGRSGSSIGGLIGDLLGGTVSDSYATGAVSGADSVGGLFAYNESSDIVRSYALGNVDASDGGMDIGGLAGINKGQVRDSFAMGAVTGDQGVLYLGGLIGDNFGPISGSFASGDVTGGDQSGDVGYALELERAAVDYADFERQAEQLQTIDAGNVETALRTERLYAGDLFGDKAYVWAASETERCARIYESFVLKLAAALMDMRDASAASKLLLKLNERNPLEESVVRLLMKLRAQAGDMKGLSVLYADYVRLLGRELGIRPSEELMRLHDGLASGSELEI